MLGTDLLPLIKPNSKADRFSENLMKWVNQYCTRDLTVFIATEGKRQFNPALTQSGYLYVAYVPFEDGYVMGSRLSEILCDGTKAATWAFHGLKFAEVSDWWQRYISGGKCCIDPEHSLYFDRERWDVSADGKTRRCLWCGKHEQYLHMELVPKFCWREINKDGAA